MEGGGCGAGPADEELASIGSAEGRDRRRPVGSSPQPTEGGRWPGEGEWEAALAAAGRVEGGFGQRVVPRGARACCEE